MDIQTAFETLARIHGSHSMAAAALGFTKDHYRALRNGRANIPQRTAEYILLKAAEVEGECGVAPSTIIHIPASTPEPAHQQEQRL